MIPGRKKKSTEELLKRESGFVRVLPPFESHLVAMIAILCCHNAPFSGQSVLQENHQILFFSFS